MLCLTIFKDLKDEWYKIENDVYESNKQIKLLSLFEKRINNVLQDKMIVYVF